MRQISLLSTWAFAWICAIPIGTAYADTWTPSAKSVVWRNGTVSFDEYNCKQTGADGIVVEGTVTIVPVTKSDQPVTIRIDCDHLLFRAGGELDTADTLHARVHVQVVGPIKIFNTRGVQGKTALPTPDLWRVRQAPSGRDGANGGNGNNARTDFQGNWSADSGGDGQRGQDGSNGGGGTIGASGFPGVNAASIQLRVAAFAPGVTVELEAVGGEGGHGGKGGRGEDGGNAGNGGVGGKGGDGNAVHDGASGGNGGDGGNGGNGGNGGQGGPGGPGGTGGDVFLYIEAGAAPPDDITVVADGGDGGRGGEGGDFGGFGIKGYGRPAGCGGSGGTFIYHTGGGGCGTNGVNGRDGVDGHKGPPGIYGESGRPGNKGRVGAGFVKPEDF